MSALSALPTELAASPAGAPAYLTELMQTPHSLWVLADIFLKMNQVSLFLLGRQLPGFVASDPR